MMPFSETVLSWRLARGMTQARLARESGVSRPNLSAIERGEREVTLKTLRSLAAALNMRPGLLVDGCAPHADGRLLSRGALERIAASAAGGGGHLSNPREAALATGLRTAMSSRIGAAALPASKTKRSTRSQGRAADRAYFFLRTAESSEVVASMVERTAGYLARPRRARSPLR